MYIEIATPPDPRYVASRWKRQYSHHPDDYCDWRAKYNALKALSPVTREGVEAILGNQSWTRLSCDGCLTVAFPAARVGSSTVLCAPCLRAALDMLNASGESPQA